MTRRAAILAATLCATACIDNTPPEGVYPCMAGHPADCPSGWVCRADHLCWRHDLDASVSDAGADATRTVDASTCATETCNDRDDDCDGRVDEGLAVVGPPVRAGSGPGFEFGLILATPEGFGALAAVPTSNPNEPSWIRLDRTGMPLAGPIVVLEVKAYELSAAIGASGVFGIELGADGHGYANEFDRTSGAQLAPTTLGNSFNLTTSGEHFEVVDFESDQATIYELVGTAPSQILRRYRVSRWSGVNTPATLDLGEAASYGAISCGAHDEVVAITGGRAMLYQLDRGDAATTVPPGVTLSLPTDAEDVALAVAESAVDIGAANPLAIAVERPAGNGLSFLEITGATATTSPAIELTGAAGGGSIAVVSAATTGSSRHFYVAEMREMLRVWDVSGNPPAARALVIDDDWTLMRPMVSLASSSGAVRVAETDDLGNVVTRSISCH